MKKQVTEHSPQKLDSKQLAKKLRDLHNKLSEKTVYAVKKHYDVYAVAEVNTNKSVVKNLPTYELADVITKRLNREYTTPVHVNSRIGSLLNLYYHHQQEIIFYNNILKNTTDTSRRLVMHDRISDSEVRMTDIVDKIISIC